MKIVAHICRIFSGLVFVFSGFVKAVDPLGFSYKFVDYVEAFGMPWLASAALVLAVLLIMLEFAVGLSLLIGVKVNLASWGALLFMIIFTPLTLYLALKNPVSDCGCFGDAIILTNWETFYKNIIISIAVVVTFLYRNKFSVLFGEIMEWRIALSGAMAIIIFQVFNLRHLPVIDFRPYKVGNDIQMLMYCPPDAPKDVYKQVFILQEPKTGNNISVDYDAFMADSTYWQMKWIETKQELVQKGCEPPIHDFSITQSNGTDITQTVLNEDICFLLVAYDLHKSKTKHQAKINALYDACAQAGLPFMCLTASAPADIKAFAEANKAKYEFCTTDPITLKTVIRANPGLVLLKKGVVLMNWHSNDIPSFDKINEKYLK